MVSSERAVIPSTTALRVFEAAARHLTCTGAADELFLTQSAVSKQIRSLEATLGVTLFIRVNRGLVLTESGRSYLEELRPLLSQLAAASARVSMRPTDPSTLTLRVLAAVGDRWLLPRFASFAQRHPDIHVQFTGFLSRDQQEQVEPDGEFRCGDGVWPGCLADYLFGRQMVLVASTGLLRQRGGIAQPADVAGFPKLVHFQVSQAWGEFAEAVGVDLAGDAPMMRYEFYSTLIRGALTGLGLALVPRALVQEELARGELVNPAALGMVGRMGYYFVIRKHKQYDPVLAAMRSWLIEQAAQTRLENQEPESPPPL